MKTAILVWCAVFWVAALAVGSAMLHRYQSTPGVSGQAPQTWPEGTHLHREPGHATLIMVAHPKCPCVKASFEELALLMAHHPVGVDVHVLFFKPTEAGGDWSQTSAWRAAAAIPGVQVSTDDASDQAHLFGCETAGDTVFYDADGRLCFHGGITASRGESGDNAGRRSLEALLQGKSALQARTEVFGCSLFATSTNSTSNHPFFLWIKSLLR
jgi:hypothetical protein